MQVALFLPGIIYTLNVPICTSLTLLITRSFTEETETDIIT